MIRIEGGKDDKVMIEKESICKFKFSKQVKEEYFITKKPSLFIVVNLFC